MMHFYPADELYASLSARGVAYLIDVLILFGAIMLTQAALRGLNLSVHQENPTSTQVHAWVLLTVSLPACLYFAACISSQRQATLGMRLLGIQVTDLSGAGINFWRAMLRTVVMLIPFELNHIVMFYPTPIQTDPSSKFRSGFIWVMVFVLLYAGAVLVTPKSQSIHDFAAGTVVRPVE